MQNIQCTETEAQKLVCDLKNVCNWATDVKCYFLLKQGVVMHIGHVCASIKLCPYVL